MRFDPVLLHEVADPVHPSGDLYKLAFHGLPHNGRFRGNELLEPLEPGSESRQFRASATLDLVQDALELPCVREACDLACIDD